ncbi:uncharacterized protein YqhL-like [Scyliorhinus torazame]|uniref:uncharacterized protein YqhL-like n=1 Tax=Scyliorhinus torazame TaxID=75743 RepID=UPI003B58FDC9
MEPVTEWIRHRFPLAENVSPDMVEQWMKENRERLLLLDVRSPAEYQVSHLQGAIRVDPETTNMGELVKTLGLEGGGADPAVVCYCTVGFHASQLAQKLRNVPGGNTRETLHSSTSIYNLEGGLLKWANDRKALVDSGLQPTRLVHPSTELWAQLLRAEFEAPGDVAQ